MWRVPPTFLLPPTLLRPNRFHLLVTLNNGNVRVQCCVATFSVLLGTHLGTQSWATEQRPLLPVPETEVFLLVEHGPRGCVEAEVGGGGAHTGTRCAVAHCGGETGPEGQPGLAPFTRPSLRAGRAAFGGWGGGGGGDEGPRPCV